MRNAFDLMTFTRFLIAEKTSRYFRTGHIVNALSAAQNRVAALLRTEDAGFFVTSTDFQMVIDQPNYDLPMFFKAPTYMERVDGNFQETPVEVRARRTKAPGARSSDVTYDIMGKQVWFHPRPYTATATYRMWYTYSLPDLLYGQAPAGGSVSDILLAIAPNTEQNWFAASPLDDYYNGVTVEVVSGGTAAGEIFEVDDYVGATRAVTPVANLSNPLVVDDVYASHIQVDEDIWEPLCLMAAHLSRVRDKDGNYLFGREFISAWQTIVGDTRLRLNSMGEVRLYGIDGVA